MTMKRSFDDSFSESSLRSSVQHLLTQRPPLAPLTHDNNEQKQDISQYQKLLSQHETSRVVPSTSLRLNHNYTFNDFPDDSFSSTHSATTGLGIIFGSSSHLSTRGGQFEVPTSSLRSLQVPVSVPIRIPHPHLPTTAIGEHRSHQIDVSFSPSPLVGSPYVFPTNPQAALHGFDDSPYSTCPDIDFAAPSPSLRSLLSPTSGIANMGLTEEELPPPSPEDYSMDMDMGLDDTATSEDITLNSPDETMIGLFPDFNMRKYVSDNRSPEIGIDPKYLLGDCGSPVKAEEQKSPSLFLPERLSASPSAPSEDTNENDAVNAIISVLSASLDRPTTETISLWPQAYPDSPPLPNAEVQGDYKFVSPRLSLNVSSSIPIPAARSLQPFPPHRIPLADITQGEIIPTSPILNAHTGIDVDTLRRKAEEYRSLNPGRDIDKQWLQAFSGRLSVEGALMEDYRCYVKDCKQSNRRRDHILVHVGSHIEHRPFQCEECGMKFLRKNECKRHATSHRGERPYACEICAPHQERSFVRQDLLKRHMKVTHGVASGARSTIPKPKLKKRNRLRSEEDDDDDDFRL
ncbi:hypothetical protein C8Q75DRAFT_802445 [Abortiporus biennis]|nr:hypothetical protein C8Q75DRAFT_802445 [Abortiporus biennis]